MPGWIIGFSIAADGPLARKTAVETGAEIMRQDIEDLIRDIVMRQLTSQLVDRVVVMEDREDAEDSTIRIVVVMKRTPSTADYTRMVGLARHLRSGLETLHSYSFPLLSFVSKKDAKAKLALEAA